MMYKVILLVLTMAVLGCSNSTAQINFKKLKDKVSEATGVDLDGTLDQDQIANGLKEALNIGVEDAVASLSLPNGYLNSSYKILIPEEAQTVISKVSLIPGFENVESELISRMNKAAELAAAKATPIFVDAITSMSFTDAKNILMGDDRAATSYLIKTTSKPLTEAFLPVIQSSLDEVNARTYWKSVVQAYNQIPFINKVNPELDIYVTQKGLDGLYELIAVKEADIRDNPALRQTELLRRVFAEQD